MDDLSVSGCSGIGFGSEERTRNQGMETREWQRLCAADVRGGIKTEGATTRDTNWACGFMRPIEDQYQKCCAAKKRWIGRFNFLIKTVMALFLGVFFYKTTNLKQSEPRFQIKTGIDFMITVIRPSKWLKGIPAAEISTKQIQFLFSFFFFKCAHPPQNNTHSE